MPDARLTRHEEKGVAWYTFGILDEFQFLDHWITTRIGGTSAGGYKSLNLGHHVGDDAGNVEANKKKARDIFCGGKPIYTSKQVHGNGVLMVTQSTIKKFAADCLLVSEADVPAGILTADCLPIILVDPVHKMAGLVHAGRKGIFAMVIPTAVSAMTMFSNTEPETITAALGPGIRACCYEVGDDVFEKGYEDFIKYKNRDGKLDIAEAAKDQLAGSGVARENIYDSHVCTSCEKKEFYSHRAEKGKTGRFMTGLAIKSIT